jgi:PAS domain S-box-containing protein
MNVNIDSSCPKFAPLPLAKYEHALPASELRFRALSEFLPIGIFQTDREGNFIYTNPRWQEMFGLSREESIRHGWRPVLHEDDHDHVISEWERSITTHTEFNLEFRIHHGRGDVRVVHVRSRPMQTNELDATSHVGSVEDITDHKLAEQSLRQMLLDVAEARRKLETQSTLLREQNVALEKAQAKAELANRSKSEFLANMSHEIRTPMTSIMGFAELLSDDRNGVLDNEQRNAFVTTIKRNGEHLLSIINDILDLSKIEAGKLTVERVEVNIRGLVQEVISLMQVKADAKRLGVKAIFPATLPRFVQTDPVRLRQILVNLVGNAIKFTELGEVTIRVCYSPAVPTQLIIAVIDTGIGMSADQKSRIFSAFEQADTSTTRRFGGTGLGLLISQRLAGMLGGTIEVDSELSLGSEFRLNIEVGVTSQPPETQEAPSHESPLTVKPSRGAEPLTGKRVLFAEDGPDNQRLISFYLRKAGAKVCVVSDGKEALEAMTSDGTIDGPLLNPLPYDLIVSDMLMPNIDGYLFARMLRAKGFQEPILALTANTMQGDMEKCFQAGCTHFASKPVDRIKFIQLCVEASEPSYNHSASST